MRRPITGLALATALTSAALTSAIVSSTEARASLPIPCAGEGTARHPEALAAAEIALRGLWRDAQPNWYTAFEARPPRRNVFDKQPDPALPIETVRGIAWSHGLYCIANVSPEGNEVLVRYFARATAFHEGQGWSRAFPDGLIQAYVVKRVAGAWQIQPTADDRTILLPNTVKSLPPVEAIPAPDPKTGIPCRTGTAWDGQKCVAVAVPTRKP